MSHWKIINYMSILFMVHYFLGSSRCLIYKICSCHDIAEILLKLALNTNQSINIHASSYSSIVLRNRKFVVYILFWFIGNLIYQFVRGTDNRIRITIYIYICMFNAAFSTLENNQPYYMLQSNLLYKTPL
jgi:hypothetical protein